MAIPKIHLVDYIAYRWLENKLPNEAGGYTQDCRIQVSVSAHVAEEVRGTVDFTDVPPVSLTMIERR